MLSLILGIVAVALAVVIVAFIYSGLFAKVTVKVGAAPYEDSILVYKFYRRPYKQAGTAFQDLISHFSTLTCVGIYYDDPEKVEASKLRYCVGAIANGSKDYLDAIRERADSAGYSCMNFPTVKKAVLSTFPFNTMLSIYISIYRVYPALQRYVEEHKICPHPYMEVYKGNTIHFVAPLERQEEFYAPEFAETEKPKESQ